MTPLTGCDKQGPSPRKTRFKGLASEREMVYCVDETAQHRPSPKGVSFDHAEGANMIHVGHKPYAVRIRMCIMLALICWAVLIAGVAWIAG